MKPLYLTVILIILGLLPSGAKQHSIVRPRILISTDIGGTDPDDNQSMTHLLMYNEKFDIEGLVSSPSFGNGSKKHILTMIDLYAKDYPLLKRHVNNLKSPAALRLLCKQGRHGSSPLRGYATSTEGSNWIVRCARKPSTRPLWILVWGGLDDLAQALHDAPDIQSRIRVYWIGGPNKKWCVNSYTYIVTHFPNLWLIENNSSYRGFIANAKLDDEYNSGYYNHFIKNAGHLGADFIHYYGGLPKMGDTPSLLYMMQAHPNNPDKESWGGRFRSTAYTPHMLFDRNTTDRDTVAIYGVVEFQFNGPMADISPDSVCFTMTIDKQDWNGYYDGRGQYVVKYVPKVSGRHEYTLSSPIPALDQLSGSFIAGNLWPGSHHPSDFMVGSHWYTDLTAPGLFDNGWQGAKTVFRWRMAVLKDWARRWRWLIPENS